MNAEEDLSSVNKCDVCRFDFYLVFNAVGYQFILRIKGKEHWYRGYHPVRPLHLAILSGVFLLLSDVLIELVNRFFFFLSNIASFTDFIVS